MLLPFSHIEDMSGLVPLLLFRWSSARGSCCSVFWIRLTMAARPMAWCTAAMSSMEGRPAANSSPVWLVSSPPTYSCTVASPWVRDSTRGGGWGCSDMMEHHFKCCCSSSQGFNPSDMNKFLSGIPHRFRLKSNSQVLYIC